MAATAIFDGDLAANTAGGWIAFPGSRAYSIQANKTVQIELSNDGANPINIGPGVLLNVSGNTLPYSYVVRDFPVAFIRVNNTSPSTLTGLKVYAQES